MKKATTMSHYETLGVRRNASAKEIRAAYRRLALQHHPDVRPLHELDESTRIFARINDAYSTLSDPRRREIYDLQNLPIGIIGIDIMGMGMGMGMGIIYDNDDDDGDDGDIDGIDDAAHDRRHHRHPPPPSMGFSYYTSPPPSPSSSPTWPSSSPSPSSSSSTSSSASSSSSSWARYSASPREYTHAATGRVYPSMNSFYREWRRGAHASSATAS
jgi:curved DNA-binding protein CbpA